MTLKDAFLLGVDGDDLLVALSVNNDDTKHHKKLDHSAILAAPAERQDTPQRVHIWIQGNSRSIFDSIASGEHHATERQMLFQAETEGGGSVIVLHGTPENLPSYISPLLWGGIAVHACGSREFPISHLAVGGFTCCGMGVCFLSYELAHFQRDGRG